MYRFCNVFCFRLFFVQEVQMCNTMSPAWYRPLLRSRVTLLIFKENHRSIVQTSICFWGLYITILDLDNADKVYLVWFFFFFTSLLSLFQVVPGKRFNNIVRKNGIGLTFASMGMTSFADGPADETNLTGVGEIRLIPDLSTKCRIPWY